MLAAWSLVEGRELLMSGKITAAQIVAALRKKFGEETAQLASGGGSGVRAVCPTGLTVLDRWVLGIGGIPWGRIIEISGAESSGKTTLANMLMAAAQRDGALAHLFEVEHTWEPAWGAKMGIDLDELGLSQPSYLDGEDGALAEMEVILDKVKGKRSALLVLDSVASTNTKAEFDQGLLGEPAMAEQARVWSFCLRKLNKLLSETQSTLVLLNQVRAKPGVMYGAKETTPGGNAIKFYASVRLKTNHGEKLDNGLGRIVGVTALKNKVAPPFRHADFKLSFGEGFNDEWSILNYAKENGCVEKGCRSLDEALIALGWKEGAEVAGVSGNG